MPKLALYASSAQTRAGFAAAAERAGLPVLGLDATPASLLSASHEDAVFRAPGGLVAQALDLGAGIRLSGPTPSWFAALSETVTGRRWSLLNPAAARDLLRAGPAFVKLVDGKHRDFPARLYRDTASFDAALRSIGGPRDLQLLATRTWLDIDSEYRIFTRGRQSLTVSPYRIQDEPWTPLLYTHRASFHAEAAEHVTAVLTDLPDQDVPPAAVLDVARLVDGRLVVLEANQCWGAGLYGCDPHEALKAVLAANHPGAPGAEDRWLWTPDPALTFTR